MAQTDLNIILRMRDEFTSSMQKATNQVHQFGAELDRTGRQVSQLGLRMTFVGGVITGSFAVALRTAAQYSPQVNHSVQELNNTLVHFQITVAQAVAPALDKVVNVLASAVDMFNALNPAVRDAVLQFVFIGGALTTLAGITLKVVGSIISVVGKLAVLFNPVTLSVMAVVGATILLIKNWDSVRNNVLPVITGMEVFFKTAAIGLWKLVDATVTFIEKFTVIGQLAGMFTPIKAKFKETHDFIKNNISSLEGDITRSLETGAGQWSETFDGFVTNAKQSYDDFTQAINRGNAQAKQYVFDFANYGKQVIGQMAQSMTTTLGQFFFNALSGQISSAKQLFADFGRSVLSILTQVFAKMILINTIGKIGFGSFGTLGQYFHAGGQVRRAHTGYMASDEVPIIAQAGEGIVSRRGMRALGASGLSGLNSGDAPGGGGGGVTINLTQVITAWDANDVYRNRKAISQGIIDELRTNGDVRRAIKEYA